MKYSPMYEEWVSTAFFQTGIAPSSWMMPIKNTKETISVSVGSHLFENTSEGESQGPILDERFFRRFSDMKKDQPSVLYMLGRSPETHRFFRNSI